MSHDYHETLEGFHPDQLYIDGCGECATKSANVERAIAGLDESRFLAAWLRAADQMAHTPPSGDRGGERSMSEAPMLHALWAIQVQLERLGVPVGFVPISVHAVIPWLQATDLVGRDAELILPKRRPIR
jgi:hypothetical protein